MLWVPSDPSCLYIESIYPEFLPSPPKISIQIQCSFARIFHKLRIESESTRIIESIRGPLRLHRRITSWTAPIIPMCPRLLPLFLCVLDCSQYSYVSWTAPIIPMCPRLLPLFLCVLDCSHYSYVSWTAPIIPMCPRLLPLFLCVLDCSHYSYVS